MVRRSEIDRKIFVATFARMARPEKSPEFRKTNVLRIRLTESERTELEKASSNKDVSTWARAVLLREAKAAVKKQS
jgi:hypothetical protein